VSGARGEVSGADSSTPIGNASQGEEIGGHATWGRDLGQLPIPLEIVVTDWSPMSVSRRTAFNSVSYLLRNYLANGTPSCIVALVTIERIVRGDVRWHSDNFGKGTRNNWRSLAVVHFQSTTRTKGMGTRPQHSSHGYSPVPVRC
jgi:hypothetical protein